MLGQMTLVGFNFCPRNYAAANGQLMSIAQNTALFSLLGTIYGGDGRTTFALPDLRGRVPISQGQGPGLQNYVMGQRAGVETVTLNTTQIPAHNHSPQIAVSRVNATTNNPINAYFARSTVPAPGFVYEEGSNPTGDTMHAGTVVSQTIGGNLAHENRPPYLTMQWCIATQGIFPSRN